MNFCFSLQTDNESTGETKASRQVAILGGKTPPPSPTGFNTFNPLTQIGKQIRGSGWEGGGDRQLEDVVRQALFNEARLLRIPFSL